MKILLDGLIALLIAVIVIGLGFIGYTFYQKSADKTAETVATPLPTPLPTATPSPTLACTAEERQHIIEVILAQNEAFFEQIPWVDQEFESVQALSAAVVDLDAASQHYTQQYYGQFPLCLDGYLMRDYFALVYDTLLEYTTLSVLNLYVRQNNDLYTADLLEQAASARLDWLNAQPDENTLIELERQGGVYQEGQIPWCGDQAPTILTTAYTPLLEEYASLFPTYEDFIQTRRGDFMTLLRFEEMSQEIAQVDASCPENMATEIAYSTQFMDTTLVIHIAQLAAFEQLRGDLVTAEKLETIVTWRHQRVMEHVSLIIP